MEHDLAGKKVHVDDVLQVFKSRDLKSDVLSQPGKDTVIQLGVVSDVDGREWIEATLPDGTFGFVLGPSVRSQANSPAESLAGSAQVSGEVDFVCPKCNVPQSKPGWADPRCSANHKLMHNATSLRYRAGHEGGAFGWGVLLSAGLVLSAGIWIRILGSEAHALRVGIVVLAFGAVLWFAVKAFVEGSRLRTIGDPASRIAARFFAFGWGVTAIVLLAVISGFLLIHSD